MHGHFLGECGEFLSSHAGRETGKKMRFQYGPRPVVGDQDKHTPAGTGHAQDVMGKHFAQVRPAEVEHAAEIAEGHENTDGRAGRDQNVNAAVHTLEHRDGGGESGKISFPRQPRFGTAKAWP